MKIDLMQRHYRLNRNTTVVIKSQKDRDGDIYKNTITLVHQSATLKPLELKTRKEIESAVQDIELADDQLSLMGVDEG